jgi:hypothetical protein
MAAETSPTRHDRKTRITRSFVTADSHGTFSHGMLIWLRPELCPLFTTLGRCRLPPAARTALFAPDDLENDPERGNPMIHSIFGMIIHAIVALHQQILVSLPEVSLTQVRYIANFAWSCVRNLFHKPEKKKGGSKRRKGKRKNSKALKNRR